MRRLDTPNEAIKKLQGDVRDLKVKLGRVGALYPVQSLTDASSATPLTDFPLGVSVKETSGSGYGEANPGVLETIRVTSNFGRQTWSCMTHDPPDVFVRRWIVGSASWSTWRTL